MAIGYMVHLVTPGSLVSKRSKTIRISRQKISLDLFLPNFKILITYRKLRVATMQARYKLSITALGHRLAISIFPRLCL